MYGNLTHDADGSRPRIKCGRDDIFNYEVDPTVGQYTGFEDKNGFKIFEGDIVQFQHKGDIAKIVFKLGCWMLVFPNDVYDEYLYDRLKDIKRTGYIERPHE